MTLTQLEYILAVEATGSFSRAARRCHVTQPTLSLQISKLERELGITIFDRSRQPVTPTVIGAETLREAQACVRSSRRLRELIQERQNLIAGDLRLGVIPTIAGYLLPLVAQSFMERYPLVRLEVRELVTEDIVRRLKRDELDAAVIVTPLQDTEIRERPLYWEEFTLYVSADHPLARQKTVNPDSLDRGDMALLNEGHCMRNQMLRLCPDSDRQVEGARLRFSGGSLETLRRIVERGYGFTLLPELAVERLSEDERALVRKFRRPAPVREVSLVSCRAVARRALIEAFCDHILENIPPRMKAPGRRSVVPWSDKP